MSRHNRREFLKRAASSFVAATCTIAGTKASGKVLGANDRIRVAVVGVNGRGQGHLQAYAAMKDAQVTCIVDVDRRLFKPRSEIVRRAGGNVPKCVRDLRKALDDKEIDAVSIATPNHWHSLQAIWACQAGKDVYVEKPCSHNVFEGRKLVEAARRYDRIVQHGTQSRSSRWAEMIAAIHSGKYGRLLMAYGWASKPRASIGFNKPEAPPQAFDFDLWTGPAPMQPYRKNLVPYNWHWVWDFGNGEIGNQGVHQMDIARWGMPKGAVPKSVVSLGGRFGYKDQGQTPNTQLTLIDFGDAKILFEDRGLVDGKTSKVTNEFYLEEGVVKQGRFFPKGKTEGEVLVADFSDFPSPISHHANFIECVRSHKRENLSAEILEGHLSSRLCHLGNISYRLGTDVPFSQGMKAFGDDKAACDAFGSIEQHLADVAKLNLQTATYRLGRKLTFDAKAEKFIGDQEADKLLTCEYRKPYAVPETV